MSTILHRREVDIAISAEESGKELAEATADVQAAFFASMADNIYTWSHPWSEQAHAIAKEFSAADRRQVLFILRKLVENIEG